MENNNSNNSNSLDIRAIIQEELGKLQSKSSQEQDWQTKINTLESTLKKEREEAAKARNGLLKREAKAALKAELIGKVLPEAVGTVTDLFESRGWLNASEAGPMIKMGDAQYTVQEGINAFMQSNEAKFFMPAPETKKESIPVVAPTFSNGSNGSAQTKEQKMAAWKAEFIKSL